MVRRVLGVVCGLVIAFAMVFATDALFHLIWPADAARPSDPAALRDYAMRQPAAALAAIVGGWALAVFVGAAAAIGIARPRTTRAGAGPGWAVTLLFLMAAAANFMAIPHPVWMIVAALVAILAAGWLAVRVAAPGASPFSRSDHSRGRVA